MSHTHEYDTRVIPLGRKTQVVKVVGDELQVPEVYGLTLGEFDADQVATADDGGFQ
jgi:hypothetical protein